MIGSIFAVITPPPISDCLSRIGLVLGLVGMIVPVCILFDIINPRSSFFTDWLSDVFFGPLGLAVAMAFCYWPLISEVL